MKIFLFLVPFLTVGLTAQTVTYSESFDAGIPATWQIVNNDNNLPDSAVIQYTDAWITAVDPLNTMDTVASATSFFSPIDRADRWLITDTVVLGAFGNSITWETRSHDPSFPESYKVLISNTDTQLSSFTDTVALVTDTPPDWSSYTINLSDLGYNNDTVYFAFVLTTFDGFIIYLDDISVTVDDPVSTDNLNLIKDQLSVYPNPSTDVFTVKSSVNQKFKLYTATGKLVKEAYTNEPISCRALNAGVYFIKLESPTGAVVKKLIIKN